MKDTVKLDSMIQECVIEMLQDMFGDESVPKMFKGERLYVTVDGKRADIDLLNMVVSCPEDETIERTVHSAITKLYSALAPVKAPHSS